MFSKQKAKSKKQCNEKDKKTLKIKNIKNMFFKLL